MTLQENFVRDISNAPDGVSVMTIPEIKNTMTISCDSAKDIVIYVYFPKDENDSHVVAIQKEHFTLSGSGTDYKLSFFMGGYATISVEVRNSIIDSLWIVTTTKNYSFYKGTWAWGLSTAGETVSK